MMEGLVNAMKVWAAGITGFFAICAYKNNTE
jgi:hypothetical protein